jgi:hypothetical protein
VPNVIFDGDTLYAYALFDKTLYGEIGLEYTLDNGNQHTTSVQIDQMFADRNAMPSVVSKLVIAKEIEALNAKRPQERYYREETGSEESKEIVALSTKYQLFSELTNYILVDEVAEDEKPVGLPEMHRVSNMLVDTVSVCESNVYYSMAAPTEERSISLRESSDALYSYNEDILDAPVFLRKQMDEGSIQKSPESLRFNDLPEEESIKTDIDHIWNTIEVSAYKRYLQLLNDWFVSHHRLPRKKHELSLVGFDIKTVDSFDNNNFREEIKMFAVRLYVECDDHTSLDPSFVKYMEKKF